MKFKVTQTLYNDEGYLTTYKDKFTELFARVGQVFERFELTEELREEFDVYDDIWKFIFISKSKSKWFLSEEEYPSDMEDLKWL